MIMAFFLHNNRLGPDTLRDHSENGIYLELGISDLTISGNITGNPRFLDRNDFHLRSGSPGIKMDQKIDDLLLDIDGISVGTPPNIGCYETIGKKSQSGVRMYVKSLGLGFLLILILSFLTWIIYKHRSRK